jgi:glutaminyl-tRNA synthetase
MAGPTTKGATAGERRGGPADAVGDAPGRPLDFIRAKVAEDLRTGKHGGRVVTRFPPEPNGYLHIGHAKSCCLNFGIAQEFGGVCHLRFDDTNPLTEEEKYVEAIIEDVRWLGFDWREHLYFASDYFEKLYEYAVVLIEKGKAYVDSLSEDEIREYRGTVTRPGRESPYRNRSVEENLDLFERMRAGEFEDGEHVLRAKIDMASPNMLMRDPLLYRIRHARHYRTGDEWCIYPMYDFAHCLSDAIEGITHSLCTLEFENNRELYDWILDNVGIEPPRPEQTEFARLNLDYTVLSKRKLVRLVEEGHVSGWDDPRMPTIAGLRRRGVTPEAIRAFCDMIGVDRVNSRVDIAKLEYAIRRDLNQRAPRVLCVLRPLKVVITSYPEGKVEWVDAPYWPHDVPKEGTRRLPFTREIYVERDDFMEDPPKKFFRLAPGREVRLRYAYIIKCVEVVKDPATGEIIELRCTHDPATLNAPPPDGRKVKGVIHWVSAAHGLPCEVRLYDRLFRAPDPDDVPEGEDFAVNLNPESLVVVKGAFVEPSVADDPPGTRYQFERLGYFISDPVDSRPGSLVFNRTVTLRDTWAKIAARSS